MMTAQERERVWMSVGIRSETTRGKYRRNPKQICPPVRDTMVKVINEILAHAGVEYRSQDLYLFELPDVKSVKHNG